MSQKYQKLKTLLMELFQPGAITEAPFTIRSTQEVDVVIKLRGGWPASKWKRLPE